MKASTLSLIKISVFAGLYTSVSFLTSNNYYLTILTLALVWAILGVAWNVLGGYAGQISFGHASFFGLGAFTVSLLEVYFGITPLLGLPAGILIASAAGVIVGLPILRLKGSYFSLAMLAFPFVLMNIFEWLGFHEIALPLWRENAAWYLQFADRRILLLVSLGALVSALITCDQIARSQFGIELRAVREDELAAGAAGINVYRHKMIAMAVSAALAGLAGGLYTLVIGVITPAGVFGLIVSAQALVVTLFGGFGALWGPVVGALILIPFLNILAG